MLSDASPCRSQTKRGAQIGTHHMEESNITEARQKTSWTERGLDTDMQILEEDISQRCKGVAF